MTRIASFSKKNKAQKNKLSTLKFIVYATILALLVEAVILIKGYTYQSAGKIVYGYTIIITIFMLSRVLGSFFYKSYNEKLTQEQKKQLLNYEPTVSFIIPCKNEEKAIYHTIVSCLASNYPKDKIEIIAINDGSTDNTLNEMKRAAKDNPDRKVRVINFKVNKGKREAMYYGFQVSKGEILIQLDSDSYPTPESLRFLINPFIDLNVGATVGHTDPSNKDENFMTRMQTAYYFMSFRALKATESIFDMVFCCSGCYAAYRREYVIPVLDTWINEKFMGKPIIFGDDRALTNWVIREGYKTVYIAEAQAYTVVPNTLKKFLKQQVRWKKGWLINSVRIAPEIIKKDKFVAFTYLIPLIIITILTPIIAFKSLIINPIFLGISPLFYILGISLVSVMLVTHYKVYSNEKYAKYMIAYSVLNMTILSYVIIYAIYDLKNMKWGTR